MVLVDTNILIEYLKGNPLIIEKIGNIGFENISVCSISVMELYFGAFNKAELNSIKKALMALEILDINERISQLATNLMEKYSKSHNLTIPDGLIAATAINNKCKLYTLNIKDFKFINNLKLY